MTFTATWRSPSNIALIKYWGKHGQQLPRNPSLSFTLSACHTHMKLTVTPDADTPGLEVKYEGKPRPSFEPKIHKFFSIIADTFPWLQKAFVQIDSVNTFPHSAGIASSASAMSALALCLLDVHHQMQSKAYDIDPNWRIVASEIARLGSGSASRSVFPYASIWGEASTIDNSSDLFAIPWENEIASHYKAYQDTILIVSTKEKAVSSTQGHALMEDLVYADTRYAEARQNLKQLIEFMRSENHGNEFISIVESEALQLHALMMSGKQPFILMEPGTISIIKEIWRFRKETGLPVCFTLDAGTNVHLLYPKSIKGPVMDWINSTLAPFCTDGAFIPDEVGAGPVKMA